MNRHPGKTAAGIEVRETINQGFVHAELASAADTKARRVYQAAEITPSLLERHATMAVENYMSAISCYLRGIPALNDARSSKLLREEVDKLLKRLERMRALVLEADRLKSKYECSYDVAIHICESRTFVFISDGIYRPWQK